MAELDFKGWLSAGVFGGVLWGLVAFAVNSATGIFPFEGTVAYNTVVFVVGGAVLGGVTGGLLVVVAGYLPMKSGVAKGVFVAITLWLVLRIAGIALTVADPERYHPEWDEAAQGLFLAFLLGGLVGFSKDKFFK